MADGCRPEVDNDVISCQMVEGVEVVHILNFGDPSSSRLGAIRIADFVTTATTTTTTTATVYAYYPINAQPKGSGVKNHVYVYDNVTNSQLHGLAEFILTNNIHYYCNKRHS